MNATPIGGIFLLRNAITNYKDNLFFLNLIMSDSKDIKQSLQLFEKDFQLEPEYLQLEKQKTFTYEEAFLKIMRVVEDLMEKDFQQLLNVLYRIDVSESKLKEALAFSTDNPASLITKMIIERELLKVEFRKKYSQ